MLRYPNSNTSTNTSSLPDFGRTGNDVYLGMRNSNTDGTLHAPHHMDFSHELASPMSYTLMPQEQHNDGKTQLHCAVIERNLQEVQTLLFSGAAVNVKDSLSNEPLHYACLASISGIVALLLRFGAEVNARGQSGRTPLHMAATNLAVVNSLLKEGADPSSQDEKGDTPMHVVLAGSLNQIIYHEGRVMDALLQSRCDINSPNVVGLTSFHKLLDQPTSIAETAPYIVKFLKSGASVSISFPDGRTPLQVFLSRSAYAWLPQADGAGMTIKRRRYLFSSRMG